MITREQYLMGRDKQYPTTEQMEVDIAILLHRVNGLLVELNAGEKVTSGYRPGHYNVRAGGARTSAHTTCEAIDLADPQGDTKKKIIANPSILEKYNLYMEHPDATPSWCHLQTRPTRSGSRIFKP